MGTPAFALPSLEILDHSSHHLAAVVTRPDKPTGRGREVRFSPVKEWALRRSLTVLQPEGMKADHFLDEVRTISPDIIVTVAFGRLLTTTLLELPPLGAINLHASYLPAYRGAAPIHRAVIDGAAYSGVTVIDLTKDLDAGDIIVREKEEISPRDTAGTLHDRLAEKGAVLLLKALDVLAAGQAEKSGQDHHLATYAPPLTPEDERLDWNLSSLQLYNRIRGLNPWPGSYTTFNGKRLKVWRAAWPGEEEAHRGAAHPPGTVLEVGSEYLTIAAGKGILTLLDVQPSGKKCMDAGSFCCGYRIEPGCRLGEE